MRISGLERYRTKLRDKIKPLFLLLLNYKPAITFYFYMSIFLSKLQWFCSSIFLSYFDHLYRTINSSHAEM